MPPVTFLVTKATPTVTVTAPGRAYDGTAYSATALIGGVVPGVDASPAAKLENVGLTFAYYSGSSTTTGTLLSAAPRTAGTYTVVASFAGSTDYVSATSPQGHFTINQATPTVTVTDAGGTYNGQPFPATAKVAGVVAGHGGDTTPAAKLENVPLTFTYLDLTTGTGPVNTPPTEAGTYRVWASFAGSTDYLQAFSVPPVQFTINQATPTVTVKATGGTYNGSPFAATATVAGVVAGIR